ncbi:ASCH domain-containing protein [Stenotrophomonas maltophilia]
MRSEDVVISLEPRYAERILSGEKMYELRRREMHLRAGTIVWLYAKRPVGAIVGYVTVLAVHHASPSALWSEVGHAAGVTRKEFRQYFAGSKKAFALELAAAVRLRKKIHLDEMRNVEPSFCPPQFFKRISPDSMLLSFLTRH